MNFARNENKIRVAAHITVTKHRYSENMPAIHIRDVPEPVYRVLAEMAKKEHRSLPSRR